MKSCHIVAPLIFVCSVPIGGILAMPCVMCWDAGDKTKTYMKILGCSGLAVIPIATMSCIISLATSNGAPLLMNVLPYAGIATAITIGHYVEKNEQQQCNNK